MCQPSVDDLDNFGHLTWYQILMWGWLNWMLMYLMETSHLWNIISSWRPSKAPSYNIFVGDIRKSSLKMLPDLTHNLGHLNKGHWTWTWFTDLILSSTKLLQERIFYHHYFNFCAFFNCHGKSGKVWGDRSVSCLYLSFEYFCNP